MNKPLAFLLHVVGVIALIKALKGAYQLLGTFSIVDDHVRGVTQIRYGTSLLLGGIIAYFALRSASRKWSGK